jgi:hypothetical protein
MVASSELEAAMEPISVEVLVMVTTMAMSDKCGISVVPWQRLKAV